MNGNYSEMSIPLSASGILMCYTSGNFFILNLETSKGGVYIGSGGNVPLYVSGRIKAPHEAVNLGRIFSELMPRFSP
jgi:hypothetical protein